MPVAALAPEVLAELHAQCPADVRAAVLDDLFVTIDREQPSSTGAVPDSSAVRVRRLRKITAAKLHSWGLQALADDAQLLVSELVTNALRYGMGTQVIFRLVIGVECLALEVDDGSPRRPHIRDAEPDAVTGRGMVLVDALAASWGVSQDGTRTWCTLGLAQARRHIAR